MRSPVGTIVLVEDDAGHARLMEKRLRRGGVCNEIVVIRDGQSALDYLLQPREEEVGPAPARELVLLDLNLPAVGGIEVLKRLKADEKARLIPVVVITTSDSPQEIAQCYEMGCSVFLTKPFDYDAFADVVARLGLALSLSSAEEAS